MINKSDKKLYKKSKIFQVNDRGLKGGDKNDHRG